MNLLKHLIEEGRRLTTQSLAEQLDACMDLMTSYCNYEWFHNLITGDEKRVL